MDDLLGVDVLDPTDDAQHEGLDLRGDKIATHSDQLIQGLVLAKLQEDVDTVLVLEAVVQLDYIWMMQCLMKFDLVG